MNVIYKFRLEPGHGIESWLALRAGMRVLDAREQNGELCLWVLLNTDEPMVMAPVFVFGTGIPIDKDTVAKLVHLNTVQVGLFVWHVFMRKEDLP